MATTVYTVEEIELQDGNTATLRPLVVKKLRRFMKMIQEMSALDDEEAIEDVMLNCAAFCVAKEHPHYWDMDVDNGTYPDPQWQPGDDKDATAPEIARLRGRYTDAFEDAADMPTVTKIIELCGGINFNDPNLLRAAAAAAQAEAETGTTN